MKHIFTILLLASTSQVNANEPSKTVDIDKNQAIESTKKQNKLKLQSKKSQKLERAKRNSFGRDNSLGNRSDAKRHRNRVNHADVYTGR